MGNLLIILGLLFLALIVIVPLLEKRGDPVDPETAQKISRWVMPLCVLLAVLTLLRYMFG